MKTEKRFNGMRIQDIAGVILREREEQGAENVGGPHFPLTQADVEYLKKMGLDEESIGEVEDLILYW